MTHRFQIGHTPWNKGMSDFMSVEGKERMIASKKGKPTWNKGKKGVQKPYWLGKVRSQDTKLKISKTKTGKLCGELAWAWKGGIGKNRDRHSLANPLYVEWRSLCLKRDNFKCKMCEEKGRLQVHHILRFSEFPELRYDINNGITLCHAHHPRKKKDEAKLSPYFISLVAEKI